MGVESRHFLIPRPNRFRPSAGDLCAFIELLAKEHWIHDPQDPLRAHPLQQECMTYHSYARGSGVFCRTPAPKNDGYSAVTFPVSEKWLAKMMERELLLVWPVTGMKGTGLRYPLQPRPEVPYPDDPYYDLQIRLCQDYVYHTSELIDPFPAPPRCDCGTELSFHVKRGRDIYYSGRIHFHCPDCGNEFEPSRLAARVRNGWTGSEIGFIPGGACHRFAVSINCGKCLPEREKGNIAFDPELVELFERQLGCQFYQLNDLY